MISLLITVLVIVLVCGVLWWVVTLLPLPAPFGRIAQVVIALIALFWLLSALGVVGPVWRIHVPR